MNIVLLSGGSGKRLWPLSNDVRSKQFIKIFKCADGSYESMVQRVYRQIKEVDPNAQITIATSKSQISAIHNQLGEDVGICDEPSRRDTFPAVALAVNYLVDIVNIDPEEPVVICPVDPFVDDDYYRSVRSMVDIIEKGESNMVLMGIEPTNETDKFGYIVPENDDEISFVNCYKEKPSRESAQNFINHGALWNSGVFAFKIKYLLDKVHSIIEYQDYQDLLNKYNKLPRLSFDYAVVEKEPLMQVLRYRGRWQDIGTWETLTNAMEDTIIGKAIMDDSCDGVHILNEMEVPILAMGLHDVIISASPEGILVSDKEQSSYIKPYVEGMEQQVMFAEKSWGDFKVLDVESSSMCIKVTLNAGHSMNYHSHRRRDEVWVVISGTGKTIVDGMHQNVKCGDVIAMSAGCRHTIIAETELKLIEVQIGEDISVQDKQKYDLEY